MVDLRLGRRTPELTWKAPAAWKDMLRHTDNESNACAELCEAGSMDGCRSTAGLASASLTAAGRIFNDAADCSVAELKMLLATNPNLLTITGRSGIPGYRMFRLLVASLLVVSLASSGDLRFPASTRAHYSRIGYRQSTLQRILHLRGGGDKKNWGELRIPEIDERDQEDSLSSFDSMDNIVPSSEEIIFPVEAGGFG